MTLHVKLVVPEGEVWTGSADRIVAKTLDGEIGVLTGHTPVLGILATGSVVRILPDGPAQAGGWIQAAVGGGFLSVADDNVSILAREAMLGADVDKAVARAVIDTAAAQKGQGGEEPAEVSYARAMLRAAGEEA